MTREQKIAPGVMESGGAYNKHAKLPAGGGALALPLLENAVRSAGLDSGDQPIVVADYGSSQGKNSLAPIQAVIRGLRRRIGPSRAISVFHIDQPSNDFNTLFEVLHTDPESYAAGEPNVFAGAIGRSFYESVLPPCSVHLGWSSYAAMWLSRVPTVIPGHFIPFRSTGAVRAEFDRQALQDWEAFLSLRARELRPEGRLVVVLPAPAEDRSTGFENIMDQANEALVEMVSDSTILAEERARMVVRSHPMRMRELLAPFANEGDFHNLEVEDFEISELPDPAWTDYEENGDKEALGTKQAMFFRSIFMPSLASALDRVRAGDVEALSSLRKPPGGGTQKTADEPADADALPIPFT